MAEGGGRPKRIPLKAAIGSGDLGRREKAGANPGLRNGHDVRLSERISSE
jgi:hypothetical protein